MKGNKKLFYKKTKFKLILRPNSLKATAFKNLTCYQSNLIAIKHIIKIS